MRHFTLPAQCAAALLAIAMLCGCQEHTKPLDEAALSRQVRALASLSAEAAFVTAELRAGHLQRSFAAIHLQSLAEDAAKAETEIAKPAPAQLQRQHAAAQVLARQLVQALRDIITAQAGPDERLESEGRIVLRLKSDFDALGKGA